MLLSSLRIAQGHGSDTSHSLPLVWDVHSHGAIPQSRDQFRSGCQSSDGGAASHRCDSRRISIRSCLKRSMIDGLASPARGFIQHHCRRPRPRIRGPICTCGYSHCSGQRGYAVPGEWYKTRTHSTCARDGMPITSALPISQPFTCGLRNFNVMRSDSPMASYLVRSKLGFGSSPSLNGRVRAEGGSVHTPNG